MVLSLLRRANADMAVKTGRRRTRQVVEIVALAVDTEVPGKDLSAVSGPILVTRSVKDRIFGRSGRSLELLPTEGLQRRF